MLRKTLLFLLCAVMVLSLVGCNRDSNNGTETNTDPTDAPVATEEPAPTSEPTPEPTEAPTPKPTATPSMVLELDDDEKDLLTNPEVTEDLNIITDEDYIETVTRLNGELGPEDLNQLFQLEGVYVIDGDECYVRRTIIDGDESYELGLRLHSQLKNIADGAWISVMGILMHDETDGGMGNYLEVKAIEALAERGASELTVSPAD